MPDQPNTEAMTGDVIWSCKACGPHRESRQTWCGAGCGSDYQQMIPYVPKSPQPPSPPSEPPESVYQELAEARAEANELEGALKAIRGPEDRGYWIEEHYRPAGGGYQGLQAIARAALTAAQSQGSPGVAGRPRGR